MEGGRGIREKFLDPRAQEFYPASLSALAYPQIYRPYPPTPTIPVHHQPPPQYVSPAQMTAPGVPTRAVVLSMLPQHVEEGAVRAEMEVFGGVRAVELTGEGIVTVHFYDLRSAHVAVVKTQEQHVRQLYGTVAGNRWPWEWRETFPDGGMGRGLLAGTAVWAHFGARELDGTNNGALVVFNSDSDPCFSSSSLLEIFENFGAVKEVRETTWKPHHRLVEFYDIRDAARALYELNGKVVLGKRMVIEFNRPGGQARISSSNNNTTTTTKTAPRTSTTNYSKSSRCSNYHNFSFPPRLLRSKPHTNTWSIGGGNGGGGEELSSLKRSYTSNIITRNSPSGMNKSSSNYAPPKLTNRRAWKNHLKNNGETRFLFKKVEEAIEESSTTTFRDSRTTVMIRNIPNKYSQKLLLNMLDNHCIHCNEQIGEGGERKEPSSSYDFVYLPIDFNNKCNMGYGFVNLTSPEATWRLYKAFHMQPWEVFNSRKICQVTYARLQGLEALKEHFKNSKFVCDTDEYMPVVFSPPRDGKQLTDPVPIGRRSAFSISNSKRRFMDLVRMRSGGGDPTAGTDGGGASSTTTSTHAPSDQDDTGEEVDVEGEATN